MMYKNLLAVLGCCALLTACSTQSSYPSPNSSDYDAYMALGEAATSVNQSLTTLGKTEQAAYPPVRVSEPPNPDSYGMSMPASMDWNGPIQPLIQQIANSANYKLRVLGRAPAIPIIVSITAKNTPIGDILRDAGYHSGKRANIVVFPYNNTIELRYAGA